MWITRLLSLMVVKPLSLILGLLTEVLIALSVAVLIAVFSTKSPEKENNMWQSILKFLGFRAQARAVGADAKDANKAAAAAVVLEEIQKKADAEAAKKK